MIISLFLKGILHSKLVFNKTSGLWEANEPKYVK